MFIELWFVVSYLGLGMAVGFFAGLLGIGGGGIMVPVLTSLFISQGFPSQYVVHIALATSMAAIVFTSLSSMWSHHKRETVLWSIVFRMTPGILMGTFVVAYFVSYIPTQTLATIFAVLMAFISLQMILNTKPKPARLLPKFWLLSFIGSGIGSLSALISIGGGSLSVPFLTWCNVPMKKAIGTSSAIGFNIALAGVAGYFFGGYQQTGLPEMSIGYVYWPAVVAIAAVSVLTAPLGVRMAHRLPVALLKKIFAVLLMVLSIKMITTL